MAGAINMEIYYYWCTALMVLIHMGFLGYEMGASRVKNALAAGVKNILAFAFTVPAFFFVGWWIYNTWPRGLYSQDYVDAAELGAYAAPWDASMGPNLADNATGVFWAAFTLFAATTASIYSGAVIERIRLGSFVLLAVVLGAVAWVVGAAWGWHPDGWLSTDFGYHDFACSGVVHLISGAFALGVLINLGPRIGKYNPDGSVNTIPAHSLPLTLIGLMAIIVGFFGFLGGCIIYNTDGALEVSQWTTIYGTPATLSGIAFNTLMSFAGGVIGAYVMTRDPFWMMSGGLGGIISAGAGLDLYWPPLAFLIGFVGAFAMPAFARWLETKLRIDDPVGAVAVHGFCGLWGVIAAGIFAAGYPAADGSGLPGTSFGGQLAGAGVMLLLGFVPGYLGSLALKVAGVLRVPPKVEIMGLDVAEIPSRAYPESAPPHSAPAAGAAAGTVPAE
jgi:Amt family ammonium transporter